MGCPTNNSFPCFSSSVSVAIPSPEQVPRAVKEGDTLSEHFIRTLPLQEEIFNPLCPAPSPPGPRWAGLGKQFWGATVGPGAVNRAGRGRNTRPRCPRAQPGSAPRSVGTPLPGSSAPEGSGCGSIAVKQPSPAEHSCHPSDPFAVQAVRWRGPQLFISTSVPKRHQSIFNPCVGAAQTPAGVGPFLGQELPSHTGRQGQEAPVLGSPDCSRVLGVPRSMGSGQRCVPLGFSRSHHQQTLLGEGV